MSTWDMTRSERGSLADALAGLQPSDWDQPSLAAGWSVRDVVAHMIVTAEMTPPRFFSQLAGSGFKFNAMAEKNIANRQAGLTNDQLVDAYRARVDTRNAPPGPALSWLGETIVHGEDIFRALDTYRPHPVEHVVAVGNFYAGSNLLIGAKKRTAGVTLRATDTDWTRGSGPEVAGPAIALVMAMCGRADALDDLTGPGVELIRGRG
jgi:uncharacterized protein (TIGR03083 family)